VASLAKEEEVDVKRLAEMKAYLEKKITECELEAGRLRAFLQIVDSLLAEKSFKPVKIGAETQTPGRLEEPAALTAETWPITSTDGVHLADIRTSESELTLVPDANIKYEVTSPPLRAFLVARVLDPMQTKDQEAARAGHLNTDKTLTYEIEEDGGNLKLLRVRNYGDQRRLLELRNAMRWTIRRMYEKTLQPR
jgi:hypothetical protein